MSRLNPGVILDSLLYDVNNLHPSFFSQNVVKSIFNSRMRFYSFCILIYCQDSIKIICSIKPYYTLWRTLHYWQGFPSMRYVFVSIIHTIGVLSLSTSLYKVLIFFCIKLNMLLSSARGCCNDDYKHHFSHTFQLFLLLYCHFCLFCTDV